VLVVSEAMTRGPVGGDRWPSSYVWDMNALSGLPTSAVIRGPVCSAGHPPATLRRGPPRIECRCGTGQPAPRWRAVANGMTAAASTTSAMPDCSVGTTALARCRRRRRQPGWTRSACTRATRDPAARDRQQRTRAAARRRRPHDGTGGPCCRGGPAEARPSAACGLPRSRSRSRCWPNTSPPRSPPPHHRNGGAATNPITAGSGQAIERRSNVCQCGSRLGLKSRKFCSMTS
jgi:hypothetical protein